MLAGLARFMDLDQRPMHTDEAVNAHKLGELVEKGEYYYDKEEYHGPVLTYSSRILAALLGQPDFESLTESSLRGVTAIYGTAVVILLLLLAKSLGWITLLVTALLFALAPAMVFYSRYFIHEMLLVFFGLAAIVSGYRYVVSKKPAWVIFFGVAMGLMFATKETCIINFGAMAVSALILYIMMGRDRKSSALFTKFPVWHLVLALLSGALVSMAFHSSLFRHPQGIIDSIAAYQVYFNRAVVDDAHLHPWHYYLGLLIHTSNPSGIPWSEVGLLLLGGAGFYLALKKKEKKQGDYFILFTGYYTWLSVLIYSLISYKTPWNILQFYYGLLLLAGYGGVLLLRAPMVRWIKTGISMLLLVAAIHWLYTGYSQNYRHFAEPANPYVYAHTGTDVREIARIVSGVAGVYPDGRDLSVEIIVPGHEYWPLPWYLRSIGNTAWLDRVNFDRPAAPLVIAAASENKALIKKLYELPPPGQRFLYLSLSDRKLELRPGQELRIYLRKDYWDRLPAEMRTFD